MAYPRDVLVSIGLDICNRNDIVIMVQNCIRTYEDFIKVGAAGIKILSIQCLVMHLHSKHHMVPGDIMNTDRYYIPIKGNISTFPVFSYFALPF
jgi:hypothetical protein